MPLASPPPSQPVEAPAVDGGRLTQAFVKDLQNLHSVLESILSRSTLADLEDMAEKQGALLRVSG